MAQLLSRAPRGDGAAARLPAASLALLLLPWSGDAEAADDSDADGAVAAAAAAAAKGELERAATGENGRDVAEKGDDATAAEGAGDARW